MTTPVNVTDVEYARQILLSLSETVGMRLRADQAKNQLCEHHAQKLRL